MSRHHDDPVAPSAKPDTANAGTADPDNAIPDPAALRSAVRPFQVPVLRHGIVQVATSFGGFLAVCAAMYLTLDVSYWLTLALAVLAAGFVVRIFIIQHDCGHGSFFRSGSANRIIGTCCSLLTFTPFAMWRRQHAVHHGTWNDLDDRVRGLDIYSSCVTVAEYRAYGPMRRLWHRIVHHPLVANLVLPPVVFLFLFRFPYDAPRLWRRERVAVIATDLALLAAFGGLGLALGFGRVAAVQLPIIVLASMIGVWLFSVQHRFEGSTWMARANWTFTAASLEGSSHLRLPALLRWFTANIGFHHVHHLNPHVPNYRLRECHEAVPALRAVPAVSLWRALGAWRYTLWDEERGRMSTTADARA